MLLPELAPPEGSALTQAVLTTFDLDLAVLKSVPGFADDPGKFTVFRGEGEFGDLPVSDPDREAYLASVVTVPFPKGVDGRPTGYAHGKIMLFDYVRAYEGKTASPEAAEIHREHLYHLLITSANISAYDNLETYTIFSGLETGREQDGTLPLIEYLSILNPYADGRLDAIIERLCKVRFRPLPEYACEAHSFVALFPDKAPAADNAPSAGKEPDVDKAPAAGKEPAVDKALSPLQAPAADLLTGAFDELLVIAPFISCQECLSLLAATNENARVVILSQTPVIRHLVSGGLITEASGLPIRLYLIPQGKSQPYIHAKIYLRRRGERWDLFSGSMNLTPFAMTRNLEFMVQRVNPQGVSTLEDYLASFLLGALSEETVRRWLSPEENSLTKTGSAVCRRAASMELRLAHLSEMLKRGRYTEDQCDYITEYLLSPQCSVDLINMVYGIEPVALAFRRRSFVKGKSRETYVFPLKDRMLLGLVNRALHDFDGWFSPKLYSHMQGRRMESILTEIRHCPNFGDLHIFKTDIHDYDGSMDVEILSEVLRHMPGPDALCKTFLETFLRRQACLEDGVPHSDAPAVQTGSPLCGFFENIYLRDTDILLAEKAAFYARYVDDILIAAHTKEQLDELIQTLTQELEKKKLQMNQRKTLRIAPGSAFVYLGWYIKGNQVDFTPEALAELRKAIRAETKRLLIACRKNHLPEEMRLFLVISRANRLIDHWRLPEAFRVVSVDEGLREIDRMLYDMIRTVASGKKGSGRYRIRSERIREWGYKSLVNRYYRFINGRCN